MNQKRRKKNDKYAHLNDPQAQLDYHDLGMMKEDEIQRIAREFIESSSKKGFTKVLIITGKGLHSAEGPVIRPLLQWYLHKLPQVVSVQTARRDRGGDGAFEVDLR